VVARHRQNQVRQLEDTWPIDGLCIYNYQLATQVDRIDKFVHCTNLCTDQKSDSEITKSEMQEADFLESTCSICRTDGISWGSTVRRSEFPCRKGQCLEETRRKVSSMLGAGY
jgi:hypothetical protein